MPTGRLSALLGRGAAAEQERDAALRCAAKLERELDKTRRALGKLPREETVALDYPGAAIRLRGEPGRTRKRALATRKEPFTVSWLESLPKGAVLYDVGANVGAYSLIAALRPQGALRVVSIEPGFASFAALCGNLVLNGTREAVVPLPVTLGDRDALGAFGYSDLAAGAALHAGGIPATEPVAWTQPVLVQRLDGLVDRFGLPAPEHLKLDVDGAELAVLRGAGALLARPELGSVLVEVEAELAQEIEALLRGHGLAVAERYREAGTGEGRRAAYVLFRRP